MKDIEELQVSCRSRVDEAIIGMGKDRESKWTESIAVGSERFIEVTKSILGIRAKDRKIIGSEKSYELREQAASYGGNKPHSLQRSTVG